MAQKKPKKARMMPTAVPGRLVPDLLTESDKWAIDRANGRRLDEPQPPPDVGGLDGVLGEYYRKHGII